MNKHYRHSKQKQRFKGQERHISFNSMFWILLLVKRWYWGYFLSCLDIMVLFPILNEFVAYDFERWPIHDISHDYGKLGWCRRCAPARILKHLSACLFILFSTKRTSLQFTIGHRHLHVRVRHVDILRKRLPPSNLHCLSKNDELEMDDKRGKKILKTVKAKQNYFYFKEKESLPANSEKQKTPQDSEYN